MRSYKTLTTILVLTLILTCATAHGQQRLSNTRNASCIVKITGDRAFHEIPFDGLTPGFYRMTIDDRRSSMTIDPDGGFRLSILADTYHEVWTSARSDFYFYVPPGTTRFALISGGPMTVHKPDGTELNWQEDSGQHVVDVGTGDAGVWEITFQSGTFYFLGIPEFVGLAPQGMLVPAEAP